MSRSKTTTMNNKSKDFVQIRVRKNLIPSILGALELGIWFESRCGDWWYMLGGSASTDIGLLVVNTFINDLKRQSKIDASYRGYALDGYIERVDRFISEDCIENEGIMQKEANKYEK